MESLTLLQHDLQALEKKITTASSHRKKLISTLHQLQQKSATNLIHYLALRNEDIRSLQENLHQAGLSSLASSESHILKQIQSTRQRLGATINAKEISHFAFLYVRKDTRLLAGKSVLIVSYFFSFFHQ